MSLVVLIILCLFGGSCIESPTNLVASRNGLSGQARTSWVLYHHSEPFKIVQISERSGQIYGSGMMSLPDPLEVLTDSEPAVGDYVQYGTSPTWYLQFQDGMYVQQEDREGPNLFLRHSHGFVDTLSCPVFKETSEGRFEIYDYLKSGRVEATGQSSS